eukprot:tig00001704_g9578.t1
MGKGWIASAATLDLDEERRDKWPLAEIARAGPANIRELYLSNNRLESIPGAELAKLTSLEKLFLGGNILRGLPPAIGQLANLQVLFLKSNQLTSLPPEIGRLTGLKHLVLSNNELPALPREVGRLASLEQLHAYSNRLTALPPELGRLARLKELWVANNQLAALPAELGRLPALRDLDLGYNPLAAMPAYTRQSGREALEYLRSLPAPPAPPPSPPPSPRSEPAGPAPPAAPRLAGEKPARGVPAAGRDPRGMGVLDVCEWLCSVDLGRLTPAFEACAVDGKLLLTLTDADLRGELGVESALVRRRLLLEISELARKHGLAGPACGCAREPHVHAAGPRAPPTAEW